ncbi:MAG: NUDIX hydrolase [Clostridia bacterium]|nr:NUDIX hydrolase [Clostridia bacterium]
MSLLKKPKVDNNKCFTACGIVEIENKILLVRHTYGTAKNRILLPGGYVKANELPTKAAEREILEETGIVCKTKQLYSMQFKAEQWCAVFTMDYISGEPQSDGYENSEILLLTVDEALVRDDLTNMSREILKAYKLNVNGLKKSDYIAKSCTENDYAIFGV